MGFKHRILLNQIWLVINEISFLFLLYLVQIKNRHIRFIIFQRKDHPKKRL